ncbi:DUF305 domain-containing protein [Deinococcus sp. 23YEL01]|nr:DUF305 domain-containing protein [Deinococcus sp. 23YEL01]
MRRMAAGVLAALLLGGGALLALTPRQAAPTPQSTEVTFVRGMIPHHAQAITMAQTLRRRSGDRTLRSLALDIELGQQEQVRQMQGWLHLWNLPPVDPAAPLPAAHARLMGMASPTELTALNTRPVPEAETLFVQLMIRHHQGALIMARPALEAGVLPQVGLLARQITGTQRGEITTLSALLRRRAQTPLPPPPGLDPSSPAPTHHH